MNHLMGSPSDQVLLWTINVLIQVSFIAACALVIGLLLRRSPAARYWLLCSALILILLCPCFSAAIQSSGMSLITVSLIYENPVLDQGQSETPLVAPGVSAQHTSARLKPQEAADIPAASETLNSDDKDNPQRPGESMDAVSVVAEVLTPQGEPSPTILGRLLRYVVPPGLIIWAFGALLLLIQLTVKCYRLSLLLKSTQPNTDVEYAALLQQAWLAVGADQSRSVPQLVFSKTISGPIAAGIRSPKVVLPESLLTEIDAEQLRGILVHEAAHLVRRDQLMVLLQNAIGALFWIHPFVRVLNRHVAQAREEVCDNYVLASTDASSYSLTLLKLAELLKSPRAIPGTVGLFTSRWKLEQRVAGLLDEHRSRVTRLNRTALSLLVAVSVGLAIVAAFGTVSLAVAENVESDQQEDANQKPALHQPKKPDVPAKQADIEARTAAILDQHFVYKGRVVDSQGQPIDGATINVVHTSNARSSVDSHGIISSHKSLKKFRTNADGTFHVEFDDWWTRYHRALKSRQPLRLSGSSPGTVIVATAPGYAPEWISSVDDPHDKPLEITLRKNTPPIRGQLVNQAGMGIAGLTVSLVSLWSAEEGAVDRWLRELPELRKQGELPSYENNILQDSHRSAKGQFPQKTHLTANTPGIPTVFKTDREGRFQIPNIGKDRLAILKIEGPGIATQLIAVVTRNMQPVQARPIAIRGPVEATYYGADFKLVTEPDLVVEGVVSDRETGAPITARITATRIVSRIKRPGFQTSHLRNVDLDCMTDAKGRYRIEGLPRSSELTLNVIPEGNQPYFRTEFRLAEPDGLEPIQLDVQLRRAVIIHGTITEKQTGKPIPNARFDYFPLRTNPNASQYLRYQGDSSSSVRPMRQRFLSAADGSFSLLGIPGKGIIAAQLNKPDYLVGVGLEELQDLTNEKTRTLQTYDHCSITSYHVLQLVTVPPGEKEMKVELQVERGTVEVPAKK